MPWAILIVLLLALFTGVGRVAAVGAAGAFVEPLAFTVVDTRVDSSLGTPSSGYTYVLGRDDASGSAILRKYDASGGELTFANGGAVQVTIPGILPTALAVESGTTNLYIVGENKIIRVNAASGTNTWGATNTVTPGDQLKFTGVYWQSKQLYICGNYHSTVPGLLFGRAIANRGNQGVVVVTFATTNLLAGIAPTIVGAFTFGNTAADANNSANSLAVDDSGNVYVGGHLGTGAFTSDGFSASGFTATYRGPSYGLQSALTLLNTPPSTTGLQSPLASLCSVPGIGTYTCYRAQGYIDLPVTDRYIFKSTSDDGCYLVVDGDTAHPLIYDDSAHPPASTYGTNSMSAGLHRIDWFYYNLGGGSYGKLEISKDQGATYTCVQAATYADHYNKGYVFKLSADLTSILNTYFTTATAGTGGDIKELAFSKGFVFASGFWQGDATNAFISPKDPSSAFSRDVDILKLDTGLQLKARATVKGVHDNTGYSITADDNGNTYISGSFGPESANFFGSGDATNHPFATRSASKVSVFAAQLDSNFNFKWVTTPEDPQADFTFTAEPRVRWNGVLQRLFWTGYFDAGQLHMGNPNTVQTLDSPKSFLAVLDPDGKFTERVNLTVLSDFGVSGSQVKPFGGPVLNTNDVKTVANTRPRIKGSQITVSVPAALYHDLADQDITLFAAQDDAKIDQFAETRISCTGYSVDENVANGIANSYTFTLNKDTIVKINWLVEHALRVKSDFSQTPGQDAPNINGHINGLLSQAAGNPDPVVKKHWIKKNELVIAKIDSYVDDQDYVGQGLAVRYFVTGYAAYGPPNTLSTSNTTTTIAFPGSDIRRQVPQFQMTGPASIEYKWKLKIGVQVNTTGIKSAGLPLVHVVTDPGGAAPTQSDGKGSGTFFYDENTKLNVGSVKALDTTQLKGWMNGDGTIFSSTGDKTNLSLNFSATITNGNVIQTSDYSGKQIDQLKRPARVMWDYGDRVFVETVYIGNSVTFSNVQALDPIVYARLRRDLPPDRVENIAAPAGSTSGDMGVWDPAGKKFFPLRPGEVNSYWLTSGDTAERVIIRIKFEYPPIAHYQHIAGSPGVNLEPSTNDFVRFKEVKYTESTTGAAVDGNTKKFTATGPGKTVLLFGELSSPGRGGVVEYFRVRVVQSKLWNDNLPPTEAAVIGNKITSRYDTAGLGTGSVLFKNARYNTDIYDRDAITGPIIPVNLFPTAGPDAQFVVVWYERRDAILWPYQAVRYAPRWPGLSDGLNRIVIASRFGSESVAQDGSDQIVVPAETYGTNSYPAEYALNPSRFQNVKIYNQPDRTLPGYNPNEEHALLAPSLRSAAISPRPMAAYALRTGDLNETSSGASYTSDPYVLVQFFDSIANEARMKVYSIVRAATNLNVGDASYEYSFKQEMTAGEPVIPFYPLPQVIGATPCPGSYGKDGQPLVQRCYWKDHKGTPWAVSGNSFFYGYYFYPLLPDFWWPTSDKQPGDCVAFLPDVPKFAGNAFANIQYTRNDQTPAAQGIYYSTVWPQDAAILKVGETLTFPGGEYRLDHPTTTVETDDGDIITQETEGLPGILAYAAGQIVFDNMNPVMDDQLAFTKYTARIYPALEERTVSLPVGQFPETLNPANRRTTVKNGVYVFNQLPSSLQKRMFYDPIRQKLGIKGFLNNKDISDSTLTASPPAVYCLEPSILTLAERNTLNGSDPRSPFVDLASTAFAAAVNDLYNLARNPNGLDLGNNGADTEYRVGLEQKVVVTDSTGVPQTVTVDGITSLKRDKTKAAPLQALGPGLAMTANPNFLDPNNTVQISYVTIAENNSDALGSAPVTLHIIKVDKNERYRGAIKTVLSDNVFDENIILRHTGDFGGNADDLVFEWWYRAEDGTEARVPDREPSPTPWKLFADPSGNQGQGFYQLTLKGNPSAPEVLIGDSLFYVRYRHKNEAHDGVNWELNPQPNGERRHILNYYIPGIPYEWAGAGNSSIRDVDGDGEPDYRPQLAEGWIKRVLSRINPYEARINDFSGDSPATYSSLIQQLGAAYVGPVALNPDKNVIENVGLIALYETIFKRGIDLSIDLSTPISTPSIANALQLASTRLSDFYRLLGNEAYSDAQDPTIGYGSSSVEYGSLAPTIFAFQNQMSSLLEQELALLRGVDTFNGAPVNNRLYWNFTHAEGEAAYALKYNISDINKDGFINVNDAMILYPQGHGDAWGHYLTAQMFQYDLLRHRYFNWVSRSEYINSQDVVIRVDYLDERKFAQTAAAKAQAGAEIVNMTYREKYVANPQGQWQGYHDTDVNRSWGVEEWARRVGQSTYFDWVVANALLPAVHPNTNYTGVQKVDRTTVQDIAVVAANLTAVQSVMEQVNGGNNPLGLADGVLPFAFDPNFLIVGSGVQGQKFFDQTYTKALAALNNAKVNFDNANQLNNLIRQVANSETEFRQSVFEQDLAYRNQLIEIFGTPYEGTVGSGKIYPPGYQGPDTMLYMYVPVNSVNTATVPRPPLSYYTDRAGDLNNSFVSELSGITGVPNAWKERFKITFLNQGSFTNSVNYTDFSNPSSDPVAATLDNLNLPVMANGYTYVAPASWGIRTSPGELQSLVSQMVQAQADANVAISTWNDQVQDLKLSISGVQVKYEEYKYHYGTSAGKIAVDTVLDAAKLAFQVTGRIATFALDTIGDLKDDVSEFLPSDLPTAGLSFSPGDALAPARGALKVGTDVAKAGLRSVVLTTDSFADGTDIAKSLADAIIDIEQYRHEQGSELIQALQEIQKTARAEAGGRLEIFGKIQVMRDLSDQYRAKLGQGIRLIEERTAFNKRVAAQTQQNRYQDVSFRYSRNSALEKYRSSFDLAARYTYLVGRAYDFDLNLSRNDPGSPMDILSDIVRQRTIGLVDDQPHVGAGGLAEALAKLKGNYDVLANRMGLNNPQFELTTFSLRSEAFRIDSATNSDGDWQTLLSSAAVRKADLWQVPEFRRYCRPFAPETNGAQPGLVIELNTSIMPGLNFFGFPLGAGDHAYDSSVYSTRIHGVSVTFDGYDGETLAASPRAYLIPVGSDIMTIADSPDRELRVWNVADQNIPVPYPATSANLANNNWRPFVDSVSTANSSFGDVRKYSSFLATEDSLGLGFNAVQDLRLIGRSVWNTKWLLIIPGATLSTDANTGLDSFIRSVTDIKLTIDSYGYSGN